MLCKICAYLQSPTFNPQSQPLSETVVGEDIAHDMLQLER